MPVATGRFGAAMAVHVVNDGPFTLLLTVRAGKVVARDASWCDPPPPA